MKTSIFLSLICFLVSCKHKSNEAIKLQITPSIQKTLDSTLLVVEKIKIKDDTTIPFGTQDGYVTTNAVWTKKINNINFGIIGICESKSDSIEDDMFIYKIENNKWYFLYHYKNGSFITDIKFMDINFDNRNELVLVGAFPSISRNIGKFDFFNFNFKTNKIKSTLTSLKSTDSIYINKKYKNIITFTDGGIYYRTKNMYEWQNNKLKNTFNLILSTSEISNNKQIFEIVKINTITKKSNSFSSQNEKEMNTYFDEWQ